MNYKKYIVERKIKIKIKDKERKKVSHTPIINSLQIVGVRNYQIKNFSRFVRCEF